MDVHDGTSASTNTHHSVPPTPLQQAPASDDGGLGLLSINTNFDQQHQNNNIASAEPPPIRCASVKSRPSVARRISAAELEHLMLRQSAPSQSSQFQPIAPADPAGRASNEPKKFTSVSEMKRRAHQRNGNPVNGDDQQTPENHYATSNTDPQPQEDQRSRPPVLRPKTPPPPPPMNKPKSGAATYTKSNNAPPAPPPPPPNFLRQQQQLTKPSSDATTVQFRVSEETPASSEANGITSESLQTVKLRPAPLQQRKENNPINPSELFNSDLKDALARRRTKLQSMEHDSSESSVANSSNNSTPTAVNPPPPPPTTKTATTVVG